MAIINTFMYYLAYCYPFSELPNGLRYLRWGLDGEAVQPEK